MRPEAVSMLRRTAGMLLPSMAQVLRSDASPLRLAASARWASLSLTAHSSQHTSTVRPPIFTWIELSSSLQSQAAQVFSAMVSLAEWPVAGLSEVGHVGASRAVRIFSHFASPAGAKWLRHETGSGCSPSAED